MYPVGLFSVLLQCIVDELCFENIVEGLISNHGITDTFAEVYDLNTGVP